MLDVYRTRLIEQRNPLGMNAESWELCRDQARGILSECRDALANGAGTPHDRTPARHPRPPDGIRTAQGSVPVHALRAGSALVQVVAEFLGRSVTPRPYGSLSRMRLMVMVQEAVTRRLEERADADDLRLLEAVRESTRQSREAMAREIHDRVGSAAGLALRRLELYELTRNVSSATDPRLDGVKQAILETMHSTRGLVTGLRGRTHSVGSLRVALSAFVTAMAIDRPVVELRIEDVDDPLPDTLGDGLFLVLREALRNALAHARASRVTVDVRSETRRLQASVTDDGAGLPQECGAGNGIASMTERIRSLGGRLEITSAPGGGTTIELSVPMGEEWHADG
ncbi:sensor histidine kinase [Streptomyces sp. NPDC093600]|uniref:sensor histidine kinase n=1 Tax=Streptomyces sp. NPDC093600 TaxID=3366047 RepID=UPI00381DC35C